MNRPYQGKRFSILGDSLSTLEGCNPTGYNLFYAGATRARTGVWGIQDTWWGSVISYFGGSLLVNNAWSGSRVTKLPEQEQLFPSACSDERTRGLHRGWKRPDVILIFLGTNDWARGVPLQGIGGAPEQYFCSAYAQMLAKVRRKYPKAEIWCATLGTTTIAGQPRFSFPESFGGISVELYNHAIRTIADEYGCRLLDFDRLGCIYETIDGTHPTAAGMKTLAEFAIRAMGGAAEGMGPAHLRWERSGEEIPLTNARISVGRYTSCEVQVPPNQKHISRIHATFFCENGVWFVRDEYSTHGTYINGSRLEPGKSHRLQPLDRIVLAKCEAFVYYG